MVRQIIGIEEPICQNPQIHYLSIWSIFLRFSIIMTVLWVLMWPNGIVDGKKCTKFRFHHLDFSKICEKYEKQKKLKNAFFSAKNSKSREIEGFLQKNGREMPKNDFISYFNSPSATQKPKISLKKATPYRHMVSHQKKNSTSANPS